MRDPSSRKPKVARGRSPRRAPRIGADIEHAFWHFDQELRITREVMEAAGIAASEARHRLDALPIPKPALQRSETRFLRAASHSSRDTTFRLSTVRVDIFTAPFIRVRSFFSRINLCF